MTRALLALTLLLGTGCAHRAAAPTGIYFVMVDRFADGDPKNDGDANRDDPQAFHGGDLQGVIDHLDWVQALALLNADTLSPQLVAQTLNLVLKHESDVEKVKPQLNTLVT